MTVEELESKYPEYAATIAKGTLRQWRARGSVPLHVAKALQESVTEPSVTPKSVTKTITLSDGQEWTPDPAYAHVPSRYPVPDDAPIPDILKGYPEDKARAYMRLGWCPEGYLTASQIGVKG